MLRVTVDERPRTLTFRLEGTLAGPWARELDQCLLSARTCRSDPTLRVDLTGVTFIDELGKTCLEGLYRAGAEFLGADCVTKAILEEIAQSAKHVEKNPSDESSKGG